jgi:hypothetical protein
MSFSTSADDSLVARRLEDDEKLVWSYVNAAGNVLR